MRVILLFFCVLCFLAPATLAAEEAPINDAPSEENDALTRLPEHTRGAVHLGYYGDIFRRSGVIGHLAVGYQFSFPLALDLNISPLGWARVENGHFKTAAADLLVSSSYRELKAGLGVGLSHARSEHEVFVETDEPGRAAHLTPHLAMFARLGAEERLHVALSVNILLEQDIRRFGIYRVDGLFPFSSRMGVTYSFGGGAAGVTNLEGGLRIRLFRGESNALFLTSSLGLLRLSESYVFSCDAPAWDHETDSPTTRQRFCTTNHNYWGMGLGFGLQMFAF